MILNKEEIDFVQSALIGLANRQPKTIKLTDSVWLKIETLSELTEMDKKVLALAIQGKCIQDGPATFFFAEMVSDKLDISDLLAEYLKDWIAQVEATEDG